MNEDVKKGTMTDSQEGSGVKWKDRKEGININKKELNRRK